MSLSTQNYKGTRDFYPEDMRLRKWMFGKWREVLESFGYEEYDGPILESLELYAAKTSEEIVNDQSFNFTDRGGRRVVMRPEMTPTVSRMVAKKRQELGYPLRLYSIPNCFRYERQQRGRLREFWQLNADIFGVEGVEADVEMVLLVDSLIKKFGTDMYYIKVGSRKLNEELDNLIRVKEEKRKEYYKLADSKGKMPREEFIKKMKELDFAENFELAINFYFSTSIDDLPPPLNTCSAALELKELISRLEQAGVSNVEFDTDIVRGFEYYTGIVFEVFDNNPENNRSLFGGGRYDGLVGEFGVEPVPTVGFGMGDVTFQNFLESNNLLPEQKTETDLYIIVIGDVASQAQELAQELRIKGLKVAVDLSGRKLDKQIKTAEKKGIENVLFVGEEEIKTKKLKMKNLKTGKETICSIDEISELVS